MKKKAKPAPKKKTAASNNDKALREHLVYLLKGGGAHVHFMDAVEGFPSKARSVRCRAAAYRLATPGARADRPRGHLGIQPEPEARFARISRRLLAEDAWSTR